LREAIFAWERFFAPFPWPGCNCRACLYWSTQLNCIQKLKSLELLHWLQVLPLRPLRHTVDTLFLLDSPLIIDCVEKSHFLWYFLKTPHGKSNFLSHQIQVDRMSS
jgi:hypothetical protein